MEDVKQLLTPLLSLLDGTHDVPFPKDKGKGNKFINFLMLKKFVNVQFPICKKVKKKSQCLVNSPVVDFLHRIFKRLPENG